MRNILSFLTILFFITILASCNSRQSARYTIGVSQCSDDEWRAQMNSEMKREALFHPDIAVNIRCAHDNSKKQAKDIEELIADGADLLIISPNEADELTPAIEKAFDKGIPVVLVDRRINSNKYTAYIGADNYRMGYRAGQYIGARLNGHGTIAEISGLKASTPAVERHRGLTDALRDYPNIRIVASADAGWFGKEAETAFDSINNLGRHIDLVFAHNDHMALGARRAADRIGIGSSILFVGFDALPGKGLGVESVMEGKLDATFIYPTGGDKAIEVASAILHKRPYERENILSTDLVTKDNARIMQMQTEHIANLDKKINVLDSKLATILQRISLQRTILAAGAVIIILICTLLAIAVSAFRTKSRMNCKLTRQKAQLEEQRARLVDLTAKLEQATQAKLAFFTNVSHDIRTPLTLIADPVERLIADPEITPRQRTLLENIRQSTAILLRLVGQILDFRKYETGMLKPKFTSINIVSAICEWTKSFSSLADERKIIFTIDWDSISTDTRVDADKEMLERIVYNLLSNAFKYTPDGGNISIILSMEGTPSDAYLCLQFKDSGQGIEAERLDKIFDSFSQTGISGAGSGIGLAIVKAFTKLHYGTVDVYSLPGKGSTFTIRIPLHQAEISEDSTDDIKADSKLAKQAIASSRMQTAPVNTETNNTTSHPEDENTVEKPSILIIDDNLQLRSYIADLLSDEFSITLAADGLEGLTKASESVPDAVICDVMMPTMNGMEFCKRLKSDIRTSHIPVLMLTACAEDIQRIEGYTSGADAYLTKPFQAPLLIARLKSLLENRKRLADFFSCRSNITEEKEETDINVNTVDKTFAVKLRKIIDEMLTDTNLSVEDIGSRMGLGRVQLYRKTKALTGCSPNELIRNARLEKASQLLKTTDMTIAEITYEVGFSSPSYFTKCYKEQFGVNPTDTGARKKNSTKPKQ